MYVYNGQGYAAPKPFPLWSLAAFHQKMFEIILFKSVDFGTLRQLSKASYQHLEERQQERGRVRPKKFLTNFCANPTGSNGGKWGGQTPPPNSAPVASPLTRAQLLDL